MPATPIWDNPNSFAQARVRCTSKAPAVIALNARTCICCSMMFTPTALSVAGPVTAHGSMPNRSRSSDRNSSISPGAVARAYAITALFALCAGVATIVSGGRVLLDRRKRLLGVLLVDADFNKPAILSNGVRTLVPPHIVPGTRIVVMTEDGSYAADCGTLVVPENRADPLSSPLPGAITAVFSRVPVASSSTRTTTMKVALDTPDSSSRSRASAAHTSGVRVDGVSRGSSSAYSISRNGLPMPSRSRST